MPTCPGCPGKEAVLKWVTYVCVTNCLCDKLFTACTDAVVIVWRVRGKTISFVLCNIVCNYCAQCDAHTYEQTNSSQDWVLSHWAHFTVLRFIFACIMCIIVYCVHV